VLDYLVQANLFLSPLDEERHWYRYHSIFGKFLRDRLERGKRARLEELHRAAFEWYAGEGDYQEAAEHALAAGDAERAAQLMEHGARELFLAGQLVTLGTWGERFPLEVLDRYPMLQLTYCYGLVLLRQYEKASEILDRLDREENRARIDATLSAELLAIRAMVLIAMDKAEALDQLFEDALSKVAEQNVTLGGGSLQDAAALWKINANCFDDALEFLGQGARLIRLAGSQISLLYNKYLVAYIEFAMGRMNVAEEQLRAALNEVAAIARVSHGGALVAVKLAEIHYERNELDEAGKLLARYHSLLSTSYPVDICITGLRTLARLYYARKDKVQAERLLTEIERHGAEVGIPRMAASARLEKIRMALQQGDLKRALDIVKMHNDKKVWQDLHGRCPLANDQETYEIGRLRLMLARGQGREVLELLKTELKKAEANRRFRQVLQLRILIARAHEACAKRKAALRELKAAVLLAQDEGFVRSFADQGQPFALLIHELRKVALAFSESTDEAVSVEFLDRILGAMGEQVLVPADAEDSLDTGPLEPLTDMETKILERVALGRSNKELAEQMSLSINTVRHHLRSIHSKLGVKRRTEAVALGRRYGLIK
jgi:LuxR family maltose regulon positive regulatory protein